MTNVTLKHLRAFVSIARDNSFSKAATSLNISQSALTSAINNLEIEIGIRLFHRTTRFVELTEQGRNFLPTAHRLLEELDTSIEDLRATTDRENGLVVIAANPGFINTVVVPAVKVLSKTHPGIRVRLVESTGEALLKRIATGEVDFGVSPLWQPTESLKARLLLKDALGILCSKTHSLSHKKDFVTWAELSGHRVILPCAISACASSSITTLRVSKLLLAPAYEVFGASATISLVASGVGVAVLPGMALGPSLQADLTFKPLKEPRKLREIHYVRSDRRPLTHAAELVSDLMLKEVRKLPFGDSFIPAPRLLAS